MRSDLRTLVTQGLHYCCPWAFFSIFRQSGEIAARLGVTVRAVQLAKVRVREEEWKCEKCERCMIKQVRTIQQVGKKAYLG